MYLTSEKAAAHLRPSVFHIHFSFIYDILTFSIRIKDQVLLCWPHVRFSEHNTYLDIRVWAVRGAVPQGLIPVVSTREAGTPVTRSVAAADTILVTTLPRDTASHTLLPAH